jgi:ribosomal protein S18 acetylase RimI-like enzyme
MTVEIRMLSATDAVVLTRVAAEVFDNPIDPAAAALFLADPRHHLAVAIDTGEVVGFASGVHYLHPDNPVPELFVNELSVAPSHQNRGLAKALLRCLFRHSRALGCGQAWVLTDEDNVPARRVYVASGGTPSRHLMYSICLEPEAADPAAGELDAR